MGEIRLVYGGTRDYHTEAVDRIGTGEREPSEAVGLKSVVTVRETRTEQIIYPACFRLCSVGRGGQGRVSVEPPRKSEWAADCLRDELCVRD